MKKARAAEILQIWNIALAVFLIVALAATFERFENGSNFFPVRLIVLCWLSAAISLWRIKVIYDGAYPPTPSASDFESSFTEKPQKSEKERQIEWRRGWKLESEASELIARLFAEKKIPLVQLERARGGHYDGGDVWSFGEPVPLTADDLYELKSNPVIKADIKGRGGILYLHGYSSNGGRLLYILNEPPDGKSADAAPPVETAAVDSGGVEKEKADVLPENKAHAFVRQLCDAKSVRLTFVRQAGSGHDPSPETWIFDRPISLTASELYALTLTEDIEGVDTEMSEDKILYAHAIRRADWVVYRFEQR